MKQAMPKLRILIHLLCCAWHEWNREVRCKDLDERYCCNGDMCGCGGETVGDLYGFKMALERQEADSDEQTD